MRYDLICVLGIMETDDFESESDILNLCGMGVTVILFLFLKLSYMRNERRSISYKRFEYLCNENKQFGL